MKYLIYLFLFLPLGLFGQDRTILKLDAYVDGPTALYPSERTKVVYRFSFSGNIDLEKEDLPLLEAMNFLKIGRPVVNEGVVGRLKVREISQIIEAISPGTYRFFPSFIEGRAYKIVGGEKVYYGNKLRSLAREVMITVKPFPKTGKPASFTGIVGTNLEMNVSLVSLPPYKLGEKMTLKITLSGSVPDWRSIKLPFESWPGFSGFLTSGTPYWSIDRNTKSFYYELYPVYRYIEEIPSIEISYFDPSIEKYVTLVSPPIPIEIE